MAVSTKFLPEDFRLFSGTGIAVSIGLLLLLILVSATWTAIYNIYFHPLSHIPGPISHRASIIPLYLLVHRGNIAQWLRDAHNKYGDVVRVAPNELSFISGETAWQDIYGFRTGKKKTPPYLKDTRLYPLPKNGAPSVILADEATHSRMRRNLSHAFSDKALREQEPLVQSLVDLLISRFHEQVQENQAIVDIMRWYNYITFDVITDLMFGEPAYCLRDKEYHPWLNMVFASAKIGLLSARRKMVPFYTIYEKMMEPFEGKSDKAELLRKREHFWKVVSAKVGARLDQGTRRPDFISHIVKNQDKGALALTREEIDSNGVLFMVAGSETTATTLSGFTYLILTNPHTYKKLVDEIRGKFTRVSDITIEEASKLEYMNAALTEAMRYYPAAPTGFPRLVPPGGDVISNVYIAEGTTVYMSQHAANHSKRNFIDPDTFAPERWLGDPRYKDDNRAVFNPFSFGPRNCLGKNLAYAELRLITAKLLFNFDLELMEDSRDWLKDQKIFLLWEKPPLNVKLHPVERS